MRRARSRFEIAAVVAAAILVQTGCSATTPPPGGRLAASQQLLASEAVDRALAQVDWPSFDGRTVFVDIGSPAADDERHYLESAVTAAVAEHGGKVTSELKTADYAVTVLGKAVGVDEDRTFFGIPALQSSLLPVGLPEIAIYRATQQRGVAKLETIVASRNKGGHVVRSGPVESETWIREKQVLVFGSRDSNAPDVVTSLDNGDK
jgi:hypothetical protein